MLDFAIIILGVTSMMGFMMGFMDNNSMYFDIKADIKRLKNPCGRRILTVFLAMFYPWTKVGKYIKIGFLKICPNEED